MELPGLEAVALEAGGELTHRRFSVGEDDRRLHALTAEQVDQRILFLARVDTDEARLDQGGRRRGPRDHDRPWTGEALVGQLLYRRTHSLLDVSGRPLCRQIDAVIL